MLDQSADNPIYSDIAVVICSCDAYSDVWPYLGQSLDQFWPDCPFSLILLSETKHYRHQTIDNLMVGHKCGWSDMLLHALPRIKQNHIIYMQDDYLLKGPTDMNRLHKLLESFFALQADYLRLFPWPSAKSPLADHRGLGELGPSEPYSTSLQAAIWRKQALLQLLVAGESGTQFENSSPDRAAKNKLRLFSVYDPSANFSNMNARRYVIDYYATGVFQGKWLRGAIETLSNAGIQIHPHPRGVLNRWDYWFFVQTQEPTQNRWPQLRLKVLSVIDRLVFKRPIINRLLTRVALRRRKQAIDSSPVD